MTQKILSFFSYFLPEKVISLAFGIFVFVNVSLKCPPGIAGYVLLPAVSAAGAYWIIAIFARGRRRSIRAAREQRELDRWFSQLGMDRIDAMSGYEFEEYAVYLLEKNGYSVLEHLGGAGDQGVDIIAVKDDIRYAVQCKCYGQNLDNTSVQEVCAGRTYYHCHVGAVLTNRAFTPGAADLADCNNILLWDREKLIEFLVRAGQT